MANSYRYMNEDEIDDELKCVICQRPFYDPVSSILCHHTFCKICIIACIDRERRCPICRRNSNHDDYQPVVSRPLLNQLNRVPVCCDACQERNIQRGNFQDHTKICPNWIIPCTAEDIRCAWQGMRNQLANHLRICPFQRIRPIIDDLRGRIQSNHRQIVELQAAQRFLVLGCFVIVLFFIFSKFQTVPRQQSMQGRNFIEKLQALLFEK
jgi:hypothetical protein